VVHEPGICTLPCISFYLTKPLWCIPQQVIYANQFQFGVGGPFSSESLDEYHVGLAEANMQSGGILLGEAGAKLLTALGSKAAVLKHARGHLLAAVRCIESWRWGPVSYLRGTSGPVFNTNADVQVFYGAFKPQPPQSRAGDSLGEHGDSVALEHGRIVRVKAGLKSLKDKKRKAKSVIWETQVKHVLENAGPCEVHEEEFRQFVVGAVFCHGQEIWGLLAPYPGELKGPLEEVWKRRALTEGGGGGGGLPHRLGTRPPGLHL
jgi:hypothetical protein